MKSQKTLYILAVIMMISLLVVQYNQSKKMKEITSEDIVKTSTIIESNQTEESKESIVRTSDSSDSGTTSSEINEKIEETHEYAKVTQEQVVQISANAFVSLFFTNKEDDRVLLKEYATAEIYESIINDNTATNERIIEFVSLRNLSKKDNVFRLEYVIRYEENSKTDESNVTLTMIEDGKDWVVSAYEVH